MKQIPVWKNGAIVAYALVDDSFADSPRRWHLHNHGYATQTIGKLRKKRVYLHQVVMGGAAGKGFAIDHIDRNPLNCCRENLRIVPQKWNAWANLQRLEERIGPVSTHF